MTEQQPANHLTLQASIAQAQVLRFTPAGVPTLDLELAHQSQIEQAGSKRQVDLVMKAVAFGVVAERLARQALGSGWNFQGFVARSVKGKSVVFHIQDFSEI